MYRFEALGVAIIFTFAAFACAPAAVSSTVFRTANDDVVSDYDAALRADGTRDLGCFGGLNISTIDVNVRSHFGASASFDSVDGCGHRALYTEKCALTVSEKNGGEVDTSTCTPALFGILELGKGGDQMKSVSTD